MSQENVEVVRAALDAWNRGDWDSVLPFPDPDIEWHNSGAVPDLGAVYHGHEGVRDFWNRWAGSWDEIRLDAEEYVDLTDRVLLLAHRRASGRNRLEVDRAVGFVFTV